MKIPQQYLPVMPYLILPNAQAFLKFTQSVFGATGQEIFFTDANTISHGEIRIGDAVIMFADATETWKEKTSAMYLYIDDVTQVYKRAMAHGAVSLHVPEQKDYGFSAGIQDPYGNQWFIVEPISALQATAEVPENNTLPR